MRKKIIAVLVFLLVFSTGSVSAVVDSEPTTDNNEGVASIILKSEDESGEIYWEAEGHSEEGFKVVWSKNEMPTYPLREGDKYNYHSDSETENDVITAFDGSGTYYVRVCEYLGEECGVYSNEIKVHLDDSEENDTIVCTMEYNPVCGKNKKTYSNLCHLVASDTGLLHEGVCFSLSKGASYSTVKFICDDGTIHKLGGDDSCKAKDDWIEYAKEECDTNGKTFEEFISAKKCEPKNEIKKIEEKAKKLSENHMDEILSELKQLRSMVKEQQTQIKHLEKLLSGVSAITEKMQNSINNFITYGVDENTQRLGEGERAAVMYSFKKAFGRLPENENDLSDAIKIANGRWPSQANEIAEEKAKAYFETIYKREADMDNPKDAAAIVVMSYGLRQRAENRNLESERKGIKIFRDIFDRNPSSTEDWNIMQAITYSGATR